MRVAAAAAFVALAACAAPPPPPVADLAGTDWRIVMVNGQTTPATGDYSMHFHSNGTFGARFGCNSMGGDFRITGGTLTATNVISTLMGCPEPAATFESRGSAILSSPMQVSFTSNERMGLSNGSGSIALDPVR